MVALNSAWNFGPRSFVLFCVLLVASGVLCDEDDDTVSMRIRQGKLLGEVAKSATTGRDYYSFKGIPYAEPPLGALRFEPPKPHNGWKGVLFAKKHGSVCPQIDTTDNDAPKGEEDCLFLNIYTPKIKREMDDTSEALPVMVFIHGNFFRSGSGNSDEFGPDYFMEEDVILITLNYRLGILGFLDLEDEIVSGNMGLKDIVMALNWIQENIKEFGGDPKKVTIFGNGSGAVAVDLLMLSTMSKGLFANAIMQSGSSLQSLYLDWGRKQRAVKLADMMGKWATDPEKLVNFFRRFNALDFPINVTRTVDVDETQNKQFGVVPFSPSINADVKGAFITKFPEEIFESGEIPNPDVNLMIGFNSQESIHFSSYYVKRPHFIGQFNKRFQFLFPIRKLYAKRELYYYREVAYRIKHFYFLNGTIDISKEKESMEEFLNFQSDLTVYPVYKSVQGYLNTSKAPVYYYRFSFDGALNHFKNAARKALFTSENDTEVDGASEKDELCYMFKCGMVHKTYKQLHAAEEEPEELKAIRKVVRLWTNFAKTGNPTPKDDDVLEGAIWKPVTKEKLHFLDIDRELKMVDGPHNTGVEFWDAMYEHYTPLATDGVLLDYKDEL